MINEDFEKKEIPSTLEELMEIYMDYLEHGFDVAPIQAAIRAVVNL